MHSDERLIASLTDGIIEIAMRSSDEVPDLPLEFAKLSLFDWMTCGIAGIGEPLAVKLRQLSMLEGGQALASVVGGTQVPPRMAALVNGATSHALDYDDTYGTCWASVGWNYPAALAIVRFRIAQLRR